MIELTKKTIPRVAAHEAASVILEAKVAISKQLLKTKSFNKMERWKSNKLKKTYGKTNYT